MHSITVSVPGLILQGDRDNLVSHNSVAQLVNTLQLQRGLQIDYRKIPMADHSFTNKLSELHHHVDDYLSRNLLRSGSEKAVQKQKTKN